jgi:hypothetical protein
LKKKNRETKKLNKTHNKKDLFLLTKANTKKTDLFIQAYTHHMYSHSQKKNEKLNKRSFCITLIEQKSKKKKLKHKK